MERITNDSDGGKILNIEQHQRLYKLMPNGDMFDCKRGELGRGWIAMPHDSARRRGMFDRFKRVGIVAPWRYENGVDIQIDGFIHLLQGAQGQVQASWVCKGCEGVYQDEPIEVDYLMAHGCRNGACPSYIKRYPQTVDFHICPHCGWKYHDPNEDVVTCPQCAGDLSRP